MAQKKPTARQQERQILEMAERHGLSSNYFFKTTFERYKVQLKILRDLKKSIKEHGATVTKEYVKGRENLVANPAITEYNKTATAANGTVSTLIKILESLSDDEEKGGKLQQLISSLNNDEYD